LVDNKTYNINDVFLQDISVKSSKIDLEAKKTEDKRNIPDGVIRHQFMNLLVKVVKDRYLTRSKKDLNTLDKQFPNIIEAMEFSLDNHYMPILKQYEVHNWRMDRYYNEYTDNILKAYLPIFDAVYKSWGVKEPGRE
jgi:hypothetical protein